jgi:hypothetical protein
MLLKETKKPKRHEAKTHTKVMRWLKYNLDKFPQSFLIETKVVRPGVKNFLYSELSEKERRLLKQAKDKFILATNSDMDRMGTICDGYCLRGGGFIFLSWCDDKSKTLYVIDIDDILEEINNNQKSLTRERASEIAWMKGELK